MTDEQHRIGARDEARSGSRGFRLSTASVVVVLGIAAVIALVFTDGPSAVAPDDAEEIAQSSGVPARSDAPASSTGTDTSPSETAASTTTSLPATSLPATALPTAALPSTAPLAFDLDFSALGMLAEVPSEGASAGIGLVVSGTDLARISASAGVEREGFVDLSQPPSPWIETLFLERSFALTDSDVLSQSVQEPETLEAELGFAFLDIDRFVTVSNLTRTDAADELALPFETLVLRSDVTELSNRAGEDQIIDVGTGTDGEEIVEERSTLRPFGRPLRLGVAPDGPLIGISSSTRYVDAWLGADSPRLVQVPDFAEAAAALDTDPELYSAKVEQFGRRLDDVDPASIGDRAESDLPIVEAFTTIGMGWSGSGADQQTSIVYVFADEAAAAASLEPIEGLFGSAPEITGAFTLDEVTTAGRSVLVRGSTPTDASPEDIRQVFLDFSPMGVHR